MRRHWVHLDQKLMDTLPKLRTSLATRYDIEREIGAGGMATVYLARDQRHERRVAVKVLNPELGAVLGVERFLAEIKVTANLQHPNLLPLFDSGRDCCST
jgi:eukaryotic-like serine/threonine-protein kinase